MKRLPLTLSAAVLLLAATPVLAAGPGENLSSTNDNGASMAVQPTAPVGDTQLGSSTTVINTPDPTVTTTHTTATVVPISGAAPTTSTTSTTTTDTTTPTTVTTTTTPTQ